MKNFLLKMIPSLMALMGVGAIFLDFYNRYFRGLSTPFLLLGLALFLLASFLLIRQTWSFVLLAGAVLATLVFSFLWVSQVYEQNSIVYYYRDWSFNTEQAQLQLKSPVGPYPPEQGPYVVCHFKKITWWDYFSFEPDLCVGFDHDLRFEMNFNQSQNLKNRTRKFQLNRFKVDRKSLLGEPLDRSALKLDYVSNLNGKFKPFQLESMIEIYEKKMEDGQFEVMEVFRRDGLGNIKEVAESSTMAVMAGKAFGLYNAQGILKDIPSETNPNYSFPAKIQLPANRRYSLPKFLVTTPN